MKLLIIGHSVEDQIHTKTREIHSPGGIFFTAMGAKNIMDPEDQICLLTSIDKKSYQLFSFLYDSFSKEYFQSVENIPKVHLYISDEAERCETYENLAENLNVSVIEDFSSFDGILVNMITGSDVGLSDLKRIRKNYNGLIYFDLHTLSRGVDQFNRRIFRPVPDAAEWISSVDILQVNENEILTLSSKNKELEIVEDIMQFGLKILVLTKGEQGSTIYRQESGKLNFFSQTAIKTNGINKVGCGDIFGAAFFSAYLKKRKLEDAAAIANVASGLVTNYSDINGLLNLRNDTFSRFN
jgi:sugar/nucleoside kinase (ribokinase family)